MKRKELKCSRQETLYFKNGIFPTQELRFKKVVGE